MHKLRFILLVCLILVIVSVAFLPLCKNGFVNWDDDTYVCDNTSIRTLSLHSINGIFTSFYMGNYHPVTMVAYLLEYHFFQLQPLGYHIISLLLHLFNCLLVFYLILKLTHKFPVAFITVIFWSIHPLNVESVAWISEMKGLLSALFYLSALISYAGYLKDKQINKCYYLSVLFFVLALLAKPMAVSLPLMLFLFDYWFKRKPVRAVFMDKIPFFVLSFMYSMIAVFAQFSAGAVRKEDPFNLLYKIMIASRCIIFYVHKIVIPTKLSCLYPLPAAVIGFLPVEFFWSTLIIVLVSVVLFFKARTKKLSFGILFFLISIFPYLQFVPISSSIVANRYAYVASIGIFYIFAEGIFWLSNSKVTHCRIASPIIIIILVIMAGVLVRLTWQRSQVWKDSVSLWNDALNNYPLIEIAYTNRGNAYADQGNLVQAISDHTKAIGINPYYADAYDNRGVTYEKQGNFTQAISDYTRAIGISPRYAKVYDNRGIAYAKQGNLLHAISDYTRAIGINPHYAKAYGHRGLTYGAQGNFPQAIFDCTKAIEIDSNYADAYYNRGVAYYYEKDYDLAWVDVHKAESLGYTINPEFLNTLKKASGRDK